MHKTLFILFATFSVCFCHGQKPGAVVNILHYTYQIQVSDANDSVKSIAFITYRILKSTNSLSLDLVSANNVGKGMHVSSVLSDGQPVKYTHSGSKLNIEVAGNVNENKTVIVRYAGIPADGLIISKTKYGKRSFFADNWPDRARHWIASVDDPADKAAVEWKVIAPTHYQVIANGVLIEETNIDAQNKLTHWKEAIELPTKVMTVGIADFAVNHIDSTGNTDISSWVYPEDRDKGFHDFGLAKEIIPFFEKVIAPFPFRKLANVQSKTTFGGLENAGAIFYAEQLITGKRTAEPTIAHEIAHQWFGDMATETDFSHLWLSEGFATFMTMYYLEKKYGIDSVNNVLKGDRQEIIAFSAKKLRPVVDSSVQSFMELLNANSYQKGGWVLHMLRHELGDDTFWKGIKSYYKTYAGKNARTADLQKIMENVSGKNLGQFFYQWLFVAGQPKLDISYKYNAQKKLVTVNVTQRQSTLYKFPLKLMLHGKANTDEQKSAQLSISEKTTSLDIPVNFEPSVVGVDEETRLLYEGPSQAVKR
jgi:aminopeptidase N